MYKKIIKNLSRRNFLFVFAQFLFACFTGLGLTRRLYAYSKNKNFKPEISKIVRVTNLNATDNTGGKDNANLNGKIIKEMVDAGIKKITGKNSVKEAWSKIIPDSSKKVAIKVNCQITGIYTKAKVVKAVTDGLILRGVSPSNIIIYDLTDTAFELAGFKKNLGSGIKIGKNSELGGYSWRSWFGIPVWRIGNKFCKVLAGEGKYGCDYLINLPVLKALDGFSGVTVSMKNHFGSIAGCSKLHSTIQDSIAKLNAHKLIIEKTRLILVDAIFTEYKWSNGRNQDHVEITNQLIFGIDPVAADYVGWQMIEKIREDHGLQPVNPKPVFIQKAACRYNLGNNNLQKIDITDI